MASSSREAGTNQADALGSALPQRTFKVAMVLCPLRGHGISPGGLGAEHPHAYRVVFMQTAPRGLALGMSRFIPGCGFCSCKMGFTICYLRLCSLETHPCPSSGTVVTWCFQKTRLSSSVD